MKTVQILCDGGLGNRLSGLIGGILTARQLNADFTISWPKNNWCGCGFEDLFDPGCVKNDAQNINDIFVTHNTKIFLIHENQTKNQLYKVFPHAIQSIETIKNLGQDVVYYHNKLMHYHDQEQIVAELKLLTIQAHIRTKVVEFCKQNHIDQNTIGLHLRKTENYSLDEMRFLQEVKNTPNKKYFVCSDDKITEENFAKLPNVCVNPKNDYVSKMIAGDWYENIKDSNGRITKYNIQRSKASVISAFEDMLILSRCWVKPTVKSSFSAFARFYSQVSLDIA